MISQDDRAALTTGGRGRVALVYPRPGLDSVPCLCQAIELLAEHGYAVDTYTWTSPGTPDATFRQPRVRVIPIGRVDLGSGAASGGGLLKRALSLPLRRMQARLGAARAEARWVRAWRAVRRWAREQPYGCVIGVDPDGLLLAGDLAGESGAPLVYYSLELLLHGELQDAQSTRLKEAEVQASRAAALTIIQDQERASLLVEDNGLDWQRVALVPNAPLGPARRRPSHYWHAQFHLAEDRRVALHAGSMGAWTGIDELVDAAGDWPDPWVLVVHTRHDAASSAYVDALRRRAHPQRVYFSLRPVPRQEYEALVGAADVGLAFYVPIPGSVYTQENIRAIGLSSGKLAWYTREGLPVVVNRSSTLGALVEREGIGVAVGSAAEVGGALARLEGERDCLSARALQFFDERLDFARPFQRVLDCLDSLVAQPAGTGA